MKLKMREIQAGDADFPDVLRHIPQPPKQLFVLGDLQPLLGKPRLAVVGARKVTPYGRSVTQNLSGAAARQGVVIVSGLAYGVDGLAHRAALEAGGLTIAVLPCGLDKPYPASHRQLAREILESGGVLISEYPEETPPLQHQFIERNRLVSGLGDGVLITEAATKSGTAHTAGFALDQGRTVMAVPGNITSSLSEGTNRLIKTGATPVTEAEDIFDALHLEKTTKDKEIPASNAEESAILTHMQNGVTDASELQLLSELDPAIFNQTLTMLEITGKIRALGAGHWGI